MIEAVKVKDVVIGEGMPKICVPIVACDQQNILTEAEKAEQSMADMVEWRADFWEFSRNPQAVEQLLEKLQEILKTKPLLFTIRTQAEGGEFAGSLEEYENIVATAAKTADLVDIEAFMEGLSSKELIAESQKNSCKVVASNHEFYKTPSQKEIVMRLRHMQKLGADVLKIAVMPESQKDVLVLLSATEEMVSEYAVKPVVTMSMAGLGAISRVAGEIFGSAVTFGSMETASAPGQLQLADLRKMLEIIHNSKEK